MFDPYLSEANGLGVVYFKRSRESHTEAILFLPRVPLVRFEEKLKLNGLWA